MTEVVVLLHGLGRSAVSLFHLEHQLRKRGYLVYNKSYPSQAYPIEKLADKAIQPALTWCREQQATRIHFVTHSLGGILIRYYLQDRQIDSLGRIVMLSPPNRGSEVAELLCKLPLYKLFSGPVGKQLRTASDSLPNSMRPVDAEIGVIAGERSSDPWFSVFLKERSDGKVTIENTRLNEMRDFIVVRHGHTYIMNSRLVLDQIEHFLKHGGFMPGTSYLDKE